MISKVLTKFGNGNGNSDRDSERKVCIMMEMSKTVANKDNNGKSISNHHRCDNVSAISTNYILNKTKALNKIKKACDKENYTIEYSDFCTNVSFNAASFVLFQKYTDEYFKDHPGYVIDESKPKELRDKQSNVAQDIIRVMDRNKRNNPPVFTLNIYRTKCKIMVNGPHHSRFGELDLPEITKLIDEMENDVKIRNSEIKESLSDNILMKPTTQKNNSVVSTENEWSIKPKYWEKYGIGEWTDSVVRECNKRKGCLKKCGKNNSQEMIRCDRCGRWCHFRCSGRTDGTDEDYICCLCEAEHFNKMMMKGRKKSTTNDSYCGEKLPPKGIDDMAVQSDEIEIIEKGVIDKEPDLKPDVEIDKMVTINSIEPEVKVEMEAGGIRKIQYGDNNICGETVVTDEDKLANCLKELITWYNSKSNNILTNYQMKPVNCPKYTGVDGNTKIYYNTAENVTYGPSSETQVVVHNSRTSETNVMHWTEQTEAILNNSKDLINSMKGSKDKDLFTIMLKQKIKISELKREKSMVVHPLAIVNNINFLARTLEIKENKIRDLTEADRKLRVEVQELKRSKKDLIENVKQMDFQNVSKNKEMDELKKSYNLLKDEMEKWKENVLKEQGNKTIELEKSYQILEKENNELKVAITQSNDNTTDMLELQKSNELLRKENEKLKRIVANLESNLTILQQAANDVMEQGNNIVVVSKDSDQQVCTDCPKYKKKADTVLRENYAMKDKVLELEVKIATLDESYKSLIETKDKTISECLEIQGSGEVELKFRRLLLHYKAENELKNMQMIKEIIAGNKDDEMEKEDEASNVEASLKSDTMSEINVEDKASNINTANNDERAGSQIDRPNESSENETGVKFCWFGSECFRGRCKFDHTGSSSPPKCRYRLRCRRPDCLFKHGDDCSNRLDCHDRESCGKRHILLETRNIEKSDAALPYHGVNNACHGTSENLVANSVDNREMEMIRSENGRMDKVEQVNWRRNDEYTFEPNSVAYGETEETRSGNGRNDKFEQVNWRRNDVYTFEPKSDSSQQYPYQNKTIYPVKRLCNLVNNSEDAWSNHEYPCQNGIIYPVKRLSQPSKNVTGR